MCFLLDFGLLEVVGFFRFLLHDLFLSGLCLSLFLLFQHLDIPIFVTISLVGVDIKYLFLVLDSLGHNPVNNPIELLVLDLLALNLRHFLLGDLHAADNLLPQVLVAIVVETDALEYFVGVVAVVARDGLGVKHRVQDIELVEDLPGGFLVDAQGLLELLLPADGVGY